MRERGREKPRGAVNGSVKMSRLGNNEIVVILAHRDVNRGLQTLVSNSGRLTIDMTTGKLNCVSKQHRPSPANPGGNFCCDGMTARLRVSPSDLCLILMCEARRKQSYGSTGMACQGRARNRMLRKRQIVRNPCYAVDIGTTVSNLVARRSPLKGGEDEITSFTREDAAETRAQTVAGW